MRLKSGCWTPDLSSCQHWGRVRRLRNTVCLFVNFCCVHVWSQEECPNCITGYNSPLLSPGFLSEVLHCHFEACNKVGFVTGVVPPSLSLWEPRFFSPIGELWSHEDLVGSYGISCKDKFIPHSYSFFSYSISMFVVSGVSWIGSMVVVKLTLASELWY